MRAHDVQALAAVGGFDDLVAALGERLRRDHALDAVVVDDEDAGHPQMVMDRCGEAKKRGPSHRLGPTCQSRDGGPDQLTPEEEGTQRSRGDWDVVDLLHAAQPVGQDRHALPDIFGTAVYCARMPNPPPPILVVEDEAGIADAIRYVLASDGFTPVCCATAADALREFSALTPRLAILDVGLPDSSGFELFHRLRALPGGADVPVLFVTARNEEIDRVAGREMGADDYIAKPFSPRELLARVRAVLRRSARGLPAAKPRGIAIGALLLDEERHRVDYCGQAVELSRYEFGILRLLMLRPGRVYTRDELMSKVWGDGSESFDRTVDAHIKSLRAKLKAIEPRIEPVRTVRGSGYALGDDLAAR